MSNPPIATTNLPSTAVLSEVVGNYEVQTGVRQTRRISITALGRQLATDGPLGSAISALALAVQTQYVRSTAAELSSIAGATDGQFAIVIGDTEAANGIYKRISGAWVRQSALPADMATLARDAAIAALAQVVELLDATAAGDGYGVTVAPWRFFAAARATPAIGANGVRSFFQSISGDEADDVHLLLATGAPVTAHGAVWTAARTKWAVDDSQMAAVMLAALSQAMF